MSAYYGDHKDVVRKRTQQRLLTKPKQNGEGILKSRNRYNQGDRCFGCKWVIYEETSQVNPLVVDCSNFNVVSDPDAKGIGRTGEREENIAVFKRSYLRVIRQNGCWKQPEDERIGAFSNDVAASITIDEFVCSWYWVNINCKFHDRETGTVAITLPSKKIKNENQVGFSATRSLRDGNLTWKREKKHKKHNLKAPQSSTLILR